jgi:hypothetical protein
MEEDMEEEPIIKALLCPIIQRETGLKSSSFIEMNTSIDDCKPPSEYGLSNCNEIIPRYYHKDYNKIIQIDYYKMIIDDIRNFRKLNSYQIDFIRKLDENAKIEIIHEFNKCIDCVYELINN